MRELGQCRRDGCAPRVGYPCRKLRCSPTGTPEVSCRTCLRAVSPRDGEAGILIHWLLASLLKADLGVAGLHVWLEQTHVTTEKALQRREGYRWGDVSVPGN